MNKILLHLVLLLVLFPALAYSLPVTVSFDVLDSEIYAGDQFSVNLVADIYEPVAGFGLDLSYDLSLLSLAAPPNIGSAWNSVFTMDGDGLAGLAPFPTSVAGFDILLATFTFDSIGAGTSLLNASFTLGDFTEGLPLAFPAPPGSFSEVKFLDTTVTVLEAAAPVPEPTTLILLSTGLAALIGFRRYRKS